MYIEELDVLKKKLDYVNWSLLRNKADETLGKEINDTIRKVEELIDTYYAKSTYWEARYKKHKQEHNENLKQLAEAIKFEFYREFEELIPSIMEEKIDALVKGHGGGEDD